MHNKYEAGMSTFILMLLMASMLAACTGQVVTTPVPAVEVTTVPLSGEELMEQRCTTCHTTARITAKSADLAEWTTIVDRMIRKGALLDNAERQILIDYLSQTHP